MNCKYCASNNTETAQFRLYSLLAIAGFREVKSRTPALGKNLEVDECGAGGATASKVVLELSIGSPAAILSKRSRRAPNRSEIQSLEGTGCINSGDIGGTYLPMHKVQN